MNATKLSLIIAILIGIPLCFALTSNIFFLCFGVPSIIAVNIIRIIDIRKEENIQSVK